MANMVAELVIVLSTKRVAKRMAPWAKGFPLAAKQRLDSKAPRSNKK